MRICPLIAILLPLNAHAGEIIVPGVTRPTVVNVSRVASSEAEAAVAVPVDDGEASAGGSTVAAVAFSERPTTVYAYLAPFYCPPCKASERDRHLFPSVRFVDREAPSWVTAYPTFHWQAADGSWKQYSGWDADQFRAMLRATVWGTSEPVNALPAEAQPTPHAAVKRILEQLNPQPSETFVDFGCGADARFVIAAAKYFGCKAVGVEIDAERAESARRAVVAAGLSGRVEIIHGDATQVDVKADVGVAYLYPGVLAQLRDKIANLDRFASYQHDVDGLETQQVGESFIYRKQKPVQYQQPTNQRYAVWNGQRYTGRVCNSRNCRMCNSIARQLGY